MRNPVKPIGRLLAVLVLLAVAVSAAGLAVAALSGRDFVRCIKTCNATRKACQDQCTVDCRALYPSDKTARDACIAACRAVCNTESDDCKLVCQGIKPPPTEESP